MPIKFACEHCGKRLSVSRKQAGVRAKCPKCRGKILVPEASVAPPDEEEEQCSDGASDEPSEPDNPYAEFVVYDDEAEWEYEADEAYAPQLPDATDIDRVSVPRRVLYAQGVLLIVVAIASFILGMMVAGDGPAKVVDAPAVPCVLSGKVVYTTGGGRDLPDEGSVVIALPTEQRPSPTGKAAIDGLRPGDPLPRDASENLQIIRSIGGAYGRADNEGRYRLQLPDKGRYFVLIVSKNKYRSDDQQLDKVDVAQLGRYVQPPTELLGESRYEWREVMLRRDEAIDLTF